jgi:hypothetical protein
VNVYVLIPAVDVDTTAGFHVPVIAGESFELNGNTGATEFKHSGPTALKVGVIFASTVILKVALVAH